MTMNPLPPQAYTKETLVKAYQWIQLQPNNIKELASTPDVLVSLFLKAKLQGEAALERPSIQNFKSELKSLAGQLGEFDGLMGSHEIIHGIGNGNGHVIGHGNEFGTMQTQVSYPAQALNINSNSPQAPHQQQPFPSSQMSHQQQYSQTNNHQSSSTMSASIGQSINSTLQQPKPLQQPPVTSPVNQSVSQQLAVSDSKSLAYIREVRISFNLSSDAEALRLIIASGYYQMTNQIGNQRR